MIHIELSEHNFEYPDFFDKLYRLLTDEVVYSNHRVRFFHLLDLFLASPLLPLKMQVPLQTIRSRFLSPIKIFRARPIKFDKNNHWRKRNVLTFLGCFYEEIISANASRSGSGNFGVVAADFQPNSAQPSSLASDQCAKALDNAKRPL